MSETPVIIEAEVISPPEQAQPKSPLIPALLAGAVSGAVVAALLHFTIPHFVPNQAMVQKQDVSLLPLEKRLAELESKATMQAATPAVSQNASSQNPTPQALVDLSPFEKRLSLLETSPQKAPANQDAQKDLDTLKNELSALKSKIQEPLAKVDLSPLASRLSALENKPANAQDTTGLKYMAQMGLLSALEAGRPFALELKTLLRLEPANPILKSLEASSESGVTSLKALSDQAASLYSAFEKAVKPPETTSLSDKVKNALSSLIKIRPLNEQAGQTPSAILSRIENRLKNSDLLGAFGEWASLEEPYKKLSSQFGKQLQAASEAKGAAAKLASDLVKSLETMK